MDRRANAPVVKKRRIAAIEMPPVVVRSGTRTGVEKKKTGSGVRDGVSSTCAVASDLPGTGGTVVYSGCGLRLTSAHVHDNGERWSGVPS